jgi:molybdopterin-guanine dinucleotide biosynthesis protein A
VPRQNGEILSPAGNSATLTDTVYGSRSAAVNPTTVIIAGGAGHRLGGVHKGLIRLGETTIIEHLLAEAPPGPKLINCNAAEPYQFLDIPVVADLEPGRGAPGGVVTALAMAATEAVLVVACDMPRVTGRAMAELLALFGEGVDVVCFERRGDLEPLCAVYRRALVHRWFPLLTQNPSLRGLVRASRVRLIQVDDDALLDSLNTPDDLRRGR